MNELEVLDDAALVRRWFKDKEEGITPEAIAKWIDRISDRKRAGHLKSFKAGNKRLFRIEDIKEYEARAKNILFDSARPVNSFQEILSQIDPDILEELFGKKD